MRRQPQARATKQQARINRFHDLKRTYLIRRRKLIWKCPLKPVVSAKKSLNFKMLISPMIRDRFCSSLIYWFKTKIGLELWEIMVLESQPCSTSLLGNFNRLLGRSLSGETVRIAYFSQQIEGLDESKRMINFLQEVAEEVKTSAGSTSIAELLEQFLFPRSTHGTLIEKLSGGEKKRLYL